MDLAQEFCEKLGELQCPLELNKADFQPIGQGMAKPLLEFVVKMCRTPSEVRRVRTAVLANTSVETPFTQEKDSCEPKTLQQLRENDAKILALQKTLTEKKRKLHIFNAFSLRIAKITQQLECFHSEFCTETTEEQSDLRNLAEAAQCLVLLASPSDFNIPAPAIQGLFASFAVKTTPKGLLEAVITESHSLTRQLSALLAHFDPSQEALALGINTESGQINVERVFADLKAAVHSKRGAERATHLKVQDNLCRAQELRRTFHELFAKKLTSTKAQLLDYHSLLIQLAAKQAALGALNDSVTSLSHLSEDLKSRLSLIESKKSTLSSTQEDSYTLSLEVTNTINSNMTLRRCLAKYKIRISDFIQNHLASMRTAISPLVEPLQTCIVKEGQEFLKFNSFLAEETVPRPRHLHGAEATTRPPNTHPLSDKRLVLIYDTLAVGTHLNSSQALSTAAFLQEFTLFSPVTEAPVNAPLTGSPQAQQETKYHSARIAQEQSCAEKVFTAVLPIWQDQPAQHCIPWHRPHNGLNLTEAFLFWRTN